MSSVASTSAPSAAKANSKAENCRETRAMRNSAAANSSAGKVSRDSSSSARGTKRRLKEQQQQRPTTRSSRRRKLSSVSNCTSSDGIDEGESDDDEDCGGAVAVESEPDNVSSTATSLKKENRPSMEGDSTKLGTDSCASSSYDMEEEGDSGLLTPWRMRRKRKRQTERCEVAKQDDERSDRRDFESNHGKEERKSELISLNDSKVPTNSIHNSNLDEVNFEVCKAVNTSSSLPFDKANTSPIETASYYDYGSYKQDVSDSDEIFQENLEERSSKMPSCNEPGVAQEVSTNNCGRMTNDETQFFTARDTDECSRSRKIDDHTNVYPRSEEHITLQVIQKLDEKDAIGSPVINDAIVNEREDCPNVLLVGGLEKETISIRISDDGAARIIDSDHSTEEEQKLHRLTEELDERIILHQRSASSSGVVNTVDDLATDPSQETATTIADPCDAEELCSKIKGCTVLKIATPDTSLVAENLTVTEQHPASLSLEILNSRPNAELCNSSRNSSQTGSKPVVRCIDGESSAIDDAAQESATAGAACRRSMNKFSTNGKFDLVDTIKVAIHAEASQIHRGKGANKLFSEYLERLGVYLGNASSYRSRRRIASASCSANVTSSDVSGSSIEAFFNFFLKTKRLRTMHNKLIMVLMKYSMEAEVPHENFCSHIPHQWLHKVTEATTANENSFAAEPVDVKKIHDQRTELMNQIRYLKSCFSTESGLWAQSDTSNVLYPPPLCTLNEVIVNSEHEDSSILPSGTLPGALTIVPLVRNIAQREGISVDEYALWLIIIATRQFAVEILQRAVDERSNSGIAVNDVISESRSGDAKPRTISTQDLALLVAKSRTIYGKKFSILSSSSRVFMDRLVNATGRRMLPCPPEAPKDVQQAIVQLIQAASCNSQAETSALACGKSVGEPVPDSDSQQLISPAGVNPTSSEPEMLRQVRGKDETPKADEEKNGSEKLTAPVASDIPRKRAGGKDLAALRARRMASTQPEQPSQESAVVANVGAAMAAKHVDSLPTGKEMGS